MFVNFAVVHLHKYYVYIGALLMGWSGLATGFRAMIIGDYNPYLAATGFLIGGALLAYSINRRLSHPKGK